MCNILISIFFTIVYAFFLTSTVNTQPVERPPEDATLDFNGLASKYGYKSTDYNLTTEDGYILTLHRLPGNKSRPVLLMHGFLDSSDTYILRGKKSLGAVLSNAGYDVWLGNIRGNKYSRRHIKLNPDTDKEFWDFSFHEMAVFDLSLFIDFILEQNNVTTVSLIGHSMGNTMFYVLGSMKPEYNDKVAIGIALGPIAYFMPENFEPPIDIFFNIGPVVDELLKILDGEEIFSTDSWIIHFRENVCKRRKVGYTICAIGIFSLVGGEDLEEMGHEFFQVVMGHYPTSTSRKVLLHFIQIAQRRKYAQLDRGPKKNMEIYNSETPPSYDLKKVTMKVAFIAGKNDNLATIKNVEVLKDKLPNLVNYHVVDRPKFNHADHIWGAHMDEYLFPHIFNLLKKYYR